MEPFDFVSPSTIEEAVKILASNGDKVRILAGGTDMLVQMRAGRRTAPLVVDIKGIPELNVMTYIDYFQVVFGFMLGNENFF